jgi:hypothetical protein
MPHMSVLDGKAVPSFHHLPWQDLREVSLVSIAMTRMEVLQEHVKHRN